MLPTLFTVFGVPVSSFWTMVFLGFFASFLVVRTELRRLGYDHRMAYDIVLYAYVGGWVGARLFVIPAGWPYFVEDPIAFLLSSSGWVWYGGLFGGTVGVLLWVRREKFPVALMMDMAGPAVAIAHAIARIGCQLSGDGDYGVPTDLPWGMSYPHGVVPTTDRVHPTPLYEMAGNLAIFAYLWRIRFAPRRSGDLFARYLLLSGVLRFLVEFVRRNTAWILGLTTAQWMGVASVVIGLILLRRLRLEPRGSAADGGGQGSDG